MKKEEYDEIRNGVIELSVDEYEGMLDEIADLKAKLAKSRSDLLHYMKKWESAEHKLTVNYGYSSETIDPPKSDGHPRG